jgi:GGDEF domain-containing protein
MLVTFLLALLFWLPWQKPGDLRAALIFGGWTLITWLFSFRYPLGARIVHSLGLLLTLYLFTQSPDTSFNASLRPTLFLALSPIPVQIATSMGGLVAGALGIALAALLALGLTSDLHALSLGLFVWLLAAILGYSHHQLSARLKAGHQLLRDLALSDPLTGLKNRRALKEDFRRLRALAVRNGLSLLVTLWDLNDLKRINDRHGHKTGDRMIVRFSHALEEALREGDGLYRIGGDEFVGLHLGLTDPGPLIQRVQRRFPWFSVGWSELGDLEKALEEADRRLYAAKEDKRRLLTQEILPEDLQRG